VKTFVVGSISTNCYVVSSAKNRSSIIIDPGFESKVGAEKVFSYISYNNLNLKGIVCTHGHPDHTCGNALVKDQYNVPICIHEGDALMLGESGKEIARFFGYNAVSPSSDYLLSAGDCVEVGLEKLTVLHTPGHSPGSMVLVTADMIFSGDTLFAASIGRTDFPGSSSDQMRDSLRKLARLPDALIVYPGHGSITNLGVEKRTNPFLSNL
jgi:hydroxyacylglutathione hydrolase